MAQDYPTAKRVLLVDDESKFCQVVAKFLRGRGYEVATAGSGTEALLALDRFVPDVMVLDIRMPGLSGLELLKLVRSRFFVPRIIMVTVLDPEEAAQEAIRLGANAYMCKPVDLNQLEQLISGIWPAQPAPQAPST